MGGEPVDWKDSLIFLPYGDCFHWHRKNFHDHHIIGSRTTVDAYSEIEEVATRQFLKCVLAKPDEPQEHIRHKRAGAWAHLVSTWTSWRRPGWSGGLEGDYFSRMPNLTEAKL
ncbi:hypothetical protein DEU56DRAFT_919303 [Suillus clintonianus]|uniref:uncharacterized protein n=1 Tax=Suillus clintonianus TaxID=1904413 RepID=UPI001B85F420|nr:uncharacterized protein DEU56DRAFT_919303 [Suillus clintonianus]KAG2116127.1 hypothetical protein DEU56DRAFT_919303 [Suillus clintonianus]